MQADPMAAKIRRQLEFWGTEFALHKDCDYLGHQSKNMIAVLMEHKGEMPRNSEGFKPMYIPEEAEQVELAVTALFKVAPVHAIVLRGYYCGQGRRNFERLEQTNLMLQKAGYPKVTLSGYKDLARMATERVHGLLLARREMGG